MRGFLILIVSILSLTAFAQQKKVAVYVTGEQSGINKVLGDQLVAAFAKSGRYTAIERTTGFLAEISKEQNYQRSGAVNDNQIARLGVQFGVNYVCVADLTDAFGEKYISARLIDVETAEVVNTSNVSGEMNSMSDCVHMASEIADNLSKGTFAEQMEEARLAKIKEEEETRKKAAEERIRQEQERIRKEDAKERAKYVDLGLPSGTLWKRENEDCGFINYEQAYNFYGNSLPTKEQWEELINNCLWAWIGNGYKVTGRSGNSIILSASGWRGCCGTQNGRSSGGSYWSSTSCGGESVWGLYFEPSSKRVYSRGRCTGPYVRLVK